MNSLPGGNNIPSILDAVSCNSTPGAFRLPIKSFHVALGYFSCHNLSISAQQPSAFPLLLDLIVLSCFKSSSSNNSTPTSNHFSAISFLTCLYSSLSAGCSVPELMCINVQHNIIMNVSSRQLYNNIMAQFLMIKGSYYSNENDMQ